MDFKEEWLFPGAVVPVDAETTQALVEQIHRLIRLVGSIKLEQAEQAEQKPVAQPAIAPWVMLTDGEIQTIMCAAETGWTIADLPTVRFLIAAFIDKQGGARDAARYRHIRNCSMSERNNLEHHASFSLDEAIDKALAAITPNHFADAGKPITKETL